MNSKKFVTKLLNDTMKQISSSWYSTLYFYTIDSKFRVMKRLDTFLKEQLNNVPNELILVAMDIKRKSKTPDDFIINILKFVYNYVKYERDETQFNTIEKWANAYEVYKNKKDDCDGINSLIYILARIGGISELNLWCCIGDTKNGGHFWLVYLSPRLEKWYTIDGTYYPDFKNIKERNPFVFSDTKYRNIWFLFNEEYIFKY